MPLTQGVYAIINKKSVTACTASDGPDPRAITGDPYEEWRSQKWDLIDLGNNFWQIRKIASAGFMGVVGNVRPDSKLFVVPDATPWNILPIYGDSADGHDSEYYYIRVITSDDLRVTLTNGGSSAPDTPIALEPFVKGDDGQMWEFLPAKV